MDRYKPLYLGKVIPADDPSKLTEFITDQYDSFCKVYDACKEHSSQIDDITPVESLNGVLSVKLNTDRETMQKIIEENEGDESISILGDVITA